MALAAMLLGLCGIGWRATPRHKVLATTTTKQTATTPAPAGHISASPPRVVRLKLEGVVLPVTAEYIRRGLAYAAQRRAQAVVIELATPGGLESAMRGIIEAILKSAVPVVGYVAPSGARAASAGFFILESCDVAAMSPGTNTGASHPVVMGGPQPKGIEAQKIQNDAAAYMRALATRRGRNAAAAQDAVVHSASYSDQEALRLHLIDLIAPNLPALLRQLAGRRITRIGGDTAQLDTAGAQVLPYGMSLRERMLNMDPDMAFLLLVAGAICIYIEFTHPGVIVPGVLGVLLMALGLIGMAVFPIRWAAAGLMLLGLALIVIEVKFPAHGLWATGGIAALTLGAVFLIDAPLAAMRIGWGEAAGLAAAAGLLLLGTLRLVLRARHAKVRSGVAALVGALATAQQPLTPEGEVLLAGEHWRAHADRPLPAGARVRVTAVHGLRLEVEAAPETRENQPQARSTE